MKNKIELQEELLDVLTSQKVETKDGKFIFLKVLKEAYGNDMYHIINDTPQEALDASRGKGNE